MKNKELSKHLKAVRVDSSNLLADLTEVVQTVVEMGKVQATDKKEQLEQELQERLDAIRESIGSVREKGKETAENISGKVKENPLLYVGGAFAVGYVIAKLFNRK